MVHLALLVLSARCAFAAPEAAPAPAAEMMAWDALAVKVVAQERVGKEKTEEVLALVRSAVDDAMNSSTPLSDGLSAEVAGAVAAHRVLTKLWPARRPTLDARLEKSLELCPDQATARKAFEIGVAAADAALSARWKFEAPRPRIPAKLPRVEPPDLPRRTRFDPDAPETLRLHRETEPL